MTQDFSGLKVKLPTLKGSCAERRERERAQIAVMIFIGGVKRRFRNVPPLFWTRDYAPFRDLGEFGVSGYHLEVGIRVLAIFGSHWTAFFSAVLMVTR